MTTPDSAYRWGKSEALSGENFDKRFLDINHRLGPLEELNLAYEALVGEVNDTVLAQVNATIDGLRVKLQQIALLQWLTAVSSTTVVLAVGTDSALLIDATARDLFTPGPFSVLQSNVDPNTFAIVQGQSYDRASGQFNFHILSVAGTPGAYSDWSVGALSGATIAQMGMLATGVAAQASVLAAAARAAADRLQADADAAATAADRLAVRADKVAADADAAAALSDRTKADANLVAVTKALAAAQSGPVVSINGRGGVVSLTLSDVPGAAAVDSPVFTGNTRVPDVSAGDSSQAAANTRFVSFAIAALVNGAPGVLDTIRELADAIGDDANFASNILGALALRLRVDASQALTLVQQRQGLANLGAMGIASLLSEIAVQGAHAQLQARRNLDTLSPGQVLALATTN